MNHDTVCCEFSLENEAFFQRCEESTAISGLFFLCGQSEFMADLELWLSVVQLTDKFDHNRRRVPVCRPKE